MGKILTFEEFEDRVRKAYNGRISVVKETYIDTKHNVTAYCNVHLIYFEVRANRLQRKETDCPECHKEHSKQPKNSWEDMLKRFRNKWGEKYSYDETTYAGYKKEMTIHCNDCGETFQITPEHHLKYNNGGCPNCHLLKMIKCANCGRLVYVDRRVSPEIYICNDCHIKYGIHTKNKDILKIKTSRCKICGRELNKEHNCSNTFCNQHPYRQFDSLIKYFGFNEQKLGTIEVENEFNRIRSMLFDMYWTKHMSSTEICKIFDYPNNANLTKVIFKYLNITPKTLSQSHYENVKMGRTVLPQSNNYKNAYHITWDNKKVFLRSSYETDYAEILDNEHIIYEVEKLRIPYYDTLKKEERIAIPDFFLPETNTIVEIKSSYTLDTQNMKDKRAAYIANGYQFKLILNHKEIDLDDEILESYHYEEILKNTKTHIKHSKWRWMHNNIERIKVALDEVEYYQSLGWILGGLSLQQQQVNIVNNVQPCAELPKK